MSFQQKLAAGEFVVMVELEPPKGVDVAAFVEQANRVKAKVDTFVVPEMANAVMKLSSLGGAILLKNRGLPAMLQVCCRDRNRLALQADLLAAAALGIEDVMAVEGEPPNFGDHHKTRPVYDIDLMELLGVIQTMAGGKDMAGIELEGAPSFTVGTTVNPGVLGALQQEIDALSQKLEAGAEFFVTPPVYDLDSFNGFMRQVQDTSAKIIPNVLLLKSMGMARAIDLHLKHVHMPKELIARIKGAPDRVKECVDISVELVKGIRDQGYAGVLISPLGWEDKLPLILERI